MLSLTSKRQFGYLGGLFRLKNSALGQLGSSNVAFFRCKRLVEAKSCDEPPLRSISRALAREHFDLALSFGGFERVFLFSHLVELQVFGFRREIETHEGHDRASRQHYRWR